MTFHLKDIFCNCGENPRVSAHWANETNGIIFRHTEVVLIITCIACGEKFSVSSDTIDVKVDFKSQSLVVVPALGYSLPEIPIVDIATASHSDKGGHTLPEPPERHPMTKISHEFTQFDKQFLKNLKITMDDSDKSTKSSDVDRT